MSQGPQSLSPALLGRQPIVLPNLDIYGYELLFRMNGENVAMVEDAEASTAQVVINAFIEFGLENVVGEHLGFINAPREFLTGSFATQLPRDRVVIEILEHVEGDDETVSAARSLADAGYVLAVDDYRPGTSADAFLPYAKIAKLDLRDYTADALAREAARLKSYGLRLVIERIETEQEFEFCRSLGFDFFQGYFLGRPSVVSSPHRRSLQGPTVRLLALLSDERATLDAIEGAISTDSALTHKLLRVVNSAGSGVHGRIDSLRQGVVFLGRDRIRAWVSMIALAGLTARTETVLTVIARARMCEVLGRQLAPQRTQAFFMVGLLSMLDRLLDLPMEDVLASLPLADDVNAALLSRATVLGTVLAAVEAYERCDWPRVRCEGLADADFLLAWGEALSWSRQIERELGSGPS